MASLEPDDLIFHDLEKTHGVSISSFDPFRVNSLAELFVSMADDFKHDIDALLVYEFILILLLAGEYLLFLHYLDKMSGKNSEASFDVIVDIVADIVVFDLVS